MLKFLKKFLNKRSKIKIKFTKLNKKPSMITKTKRNRVFIKVFDAKQLTIISPNQKKTIKL